MPSSPLPAGPPLITAVALALLTVTVLAGPFAGPRICPRKDLRAAAGLLALGLSFAGLYAAGLHAHAPAALAAVCLYAAFQAVLLAVWALYGHGSDEGRSGADEREPQTPPSEPEFPWWDEFEAQLADYSRPLRPLSRV